MKMDMRLIVPRLLATCKKSSIYRDKSQREFQEDLLENQNRIQHHIFHIACSRQRETVESENRLNDTLDLDIPTIELVDCFPIHPKTVIDSPQRSASATKPGRYPLQSPQPVGRDSTT